MSFNYQSKSGSSNNNWKAFEWGVHKVKITEATATVSKAGNGFNVSCSIEGDFGMSAKFVSLGWFRKIATEADNDKFNAALAKQEEFKAMDAQARMLNQANDKDAAESIRKSRNEAEFEYKKSNPFYGLLTQLDAYTKFIAAFGGDVRGIEAASQEEYMQKITALLVGKSAYALVMTEEYLKDGKVRVRYSFTQNFQEPKAFFIGGVKEVVFDRSLIDEETGEITQGAEVHSCLISYEKEGVNPTRIKKTAKNCVTLGVPAPNDEANDGLPTFDNDDLPF